MNERQCSPPALFLTSLDAYLRRRSLHKARKSFRVKLRIANQQPTNLCPGFAKQVATTAVTKISFVRTHCKYMLN